MKYMTAEMKTEIFWDIALLAVVMFGGSLFGYGFGKIAGYESACQSVKMEWVKGRCMKVTEEEKL
jgi:hypothetical protein